MNNGRRSARLYPGEAWSLTIQGVALARMGRRDEGRTLLETAMAANWRGMDAAKPGVNSILEQLADGESP